VNCLFVSENQIHEILSARLGFKAWKRQQEIVKRGRDETLLHIETDATSLAETKSINFLLCTVLHCFGVLVHVIFFLLTVEIYFA
jgi:hypothetical protein